MQVILRFNINTFKNAYSLMDLPKMKLNYYAIKVGEAKETDLNVENEMAVDGQTARLSPIEVLGHVESTDQNRDYLKLYDVILAGVEV
ncbi:DUF6414 family protein [Lysinibacillus sp. NPDC097195]|uniref:DUF6414 family protein n=1 Tax=Lysinibacillus sp. NPDC097195 TaxID=3364141 RepID=UPI00382DC788